MLAECAADGSSALALPTVGRGGRGAAPGHSLRSGWRRPPPAPEGDVPDRPKDRADQQDQEAGLERSDPGARRTDQDEVAERRGRPDEERRGARRRRRDLRPGPALVLGDDGFARRVRGPQHERDVRSGRGREGHPVLVGDGVAIDVAQDRPHGRGCRRGDRIDPDRDRGRARRELEGTWRGDQLGLRWGLRGRRVEAGADPADERLGDRRRGRRAGLVAGRAEIAIRPQDRERVEQGPSDRRQGLARRDQQDAGGQDDRTCPARRADSIQWLQWTVKMISGDQTRGSNGAWSAATNSAFRTYVPGWTGRLWVRP